MSKRATINSDVYIGTLKKLKARIRRVRSSLEMSKVLLQHENARSHTSLKTCEVISFFGCTTISHSPYLPDLAPSDFHLFGPLKESLRGRHFSSDEEVRTAVRKWLKIQTVEFHNEGIYIHSLKGGKRRFGKQKITVHREVTMKCSCYILSYDARFVYL